MNFVTRRLAIAALALAPALMAAPVLAETAKRDLAQEEANRKLVIEFYDTVFNKHEVEKGAAVIVDSYKQHNPMVPDGKKPFVDYFTGHFKKTRSQRRASCAAPRMAISSICIFIRPKKTAIAVRPSSISSASPTARSPSTGT